MLLEFSIYQAKLITLFKYFYSFMTLLITYKTYLTISITSIDDKRIQLYYNHLILITCKIKLVIFYTKKKILLRKNNLP